MIRLKRVYDPEGASFGSLFLVERLWPRGIRKNELRFDAWLKDVAPSTELRTWFQHDPDKWEEFRSRYFSELDAQPESWRPIFAAAQKGSVTLLYSSRDTKHNNAVALKEYLERKMKRYAPKSAA